MDTKKKGQANKTQVMVPNFERKENQVQGTHKESKVEV